MGKTVGEEKKYGRLNGNAVISFFSATMPYAPSSQLTLEVING